jgi:thymidylate kinase
MTKGHTEHVDQIAGRLAVFDELTIATSKYEVVALEGCDGTGKTTIACNLAERHGYTVLHSARPPDAIDLAERYRSILARPGKIALDRSFISELVYGPVKYGRSRLSAPDAAELAFRLADRGGVLVHLTGFPDVIAARLRARDGYAPPLERIKSVIESYRKVFDALAGSAPTITANTTTPLTWHP